ncbi:colicin transporter [Mycetohabitans sp. B8]|uniref:colicin transporter n=1 Tax=Mycetohabitans sp. B8 TaxID=2841845 RepID=UPI001F216859|nr:colicin transporter [Mycetohabitans sp. B8]
MHDRLPTSSPAPRQRARESMLPSGSLSSRPHRHAAAVTLTARRERAWLLAGWLLACVASIVPAAPLYAQAMMLPMSDAGDGVVATTGVDAEASAMPVIAPQEPSAPVRVMDDDRAGARAAVAGSPDAQAADSEGADGRARQASFGARQAQLDRRSELNRYEYGVARHNCYSAILVNHCLEKARDRMIANKMRIRDDQNALDNERRAAHARQRDEQAALKRDAHAREAPQRAARERENEQSYEEKQRQHAIDEARRNAQVPQRDANQRAYDQKQLDYQRKLEQARQQAAQDAQQRADNARKFEQKQQRAAQHAQDVRERQARAARKQRASTPDAASAASGTGGQ